MNSKSTDQLSAVLLAASHAGASSAALVSLGNLTLAAGIAGTDDSMQTVSQQ